MESGYIFPTDGDSRTVSLSDAWRGKSVNQLWSIEVDEQISAGDTLATLRYAVKAIRLLRRYTAGDTLATLRYAVKAIRLLRRYTAGDTLAAQAYHMADPV